MPLTLTIAFDMDALLHEWRDISLIHALVQSTRVNCSNKHLNIGCSCTVYAPDSSLSNPLILLAIRDSIDARSAATSVSLLSHTSSWSS
jgi:hypothetical protein